MIIVTTPKYRLNEIDPDAEDGDDDYDENEMITEHPHFGSHTTKQPNNHTAFSTTQFSHHYETSTIKHNFNNEDFGKADTDQDIYTYPNGHRFYNYSQSSHNQTSYSANHPQHNVSFSDHDRDPHYVEEEVRRVHFNYSPNSPPLHHYPSRTHHESSSSSSHSEGSHSKETVHVDTNKHKETEFHNTFNYSIDLGGETTDFKNRTVHSLPSNNNNSHGSGDLDVSVVTADGVETITTATLSPWDHVPVFLPNPIDRCRADDKVRCGDSSIYICTDQECDGRSDCPGGEDEENCPSEGICVHVHHLLYILT